MMQIFKNDVGLLKSISRDSTSGNGVSVSDKRSARKSNVDADVITEVIRMILITKNMSLVKMKRKAAALVKLKSHQNQSVKGISSGVDTYAIA